MPGEAGDYLYAAINQTLFVFAKVMKGLSPYDAADFLEDLRKNAPAGVSSVITSDHEAFGHPAEQPWEPKFPQRIHPFIKACRASHIGRTVEKSNNSTRMMVMKGWRDVVLKIREARRPRRSVIGLRGEPVAWRRGVARRRVEAISLKRRGRIWLARTRAFG
jgi:hypothetical protein